MFVNCKIGLIITTLYLAGSYGELCGFQSYSPTCQQLRQIQLSMDETVNPCHDFYGYACNNLGLQRSSSHYNNPLEMLQYQMNLQLVPVMDSVDPQTLPLRILKETLTYYKSCLNARYTNRLWGFLKIVKPGKGLEWPLLQELDAYNRGISNFSADDWPAHDFDPFALLGQLRNYDFKDVIINYELNIYSFKNVGSTLSPPTDTNQLTQTVILNMLQELGFSPETALNHTKRIEETRDYWQNLPRGKHTSAYVSFGELKNLYPYFQNMMANIDILRYYDNTVIFVFYRDYFRLLAGKELNPQEKRDLCNYIMIQWLLHLQRNSAKDFAKLDCIKDARGKLDLPVNILYYGYIYRTEELYEYTNADIALLFRKMRDYTLQRFERFFDYNLEGKKLLLLQMPLNVGNMPRNMSTLYFDMLYGNLPNLQPNGYYSNQLHLLKHQTRLKLMVYNKTHYLGSSADIPGGTERPFYDPYSKMLILPFSCMQPPIYHHSFDPIFKWSMMGYFLSEALYASFSGSSPRFDHISVFDMPYQLYVKEQNSKLQPDFTNISWKKLYFLNLAQFFCAPNGTDYREKYTGFVRKFRDISEVFKDVFQCRGSRRRNRNRM